MERKNQRDGLSVATLRRMPSYLRYLKILRSQGVKNVSSVAIATEIGLNPVQVKKDISYATKVPGKPKIGFVVEELIDNIEDFLGCYNIKEAVLVGVGKLGRSLLSYNGFSNYGLNIVAAFDSNAELWGIDVNGKKIYPIEKLSDIIGAAH